MKCGNATSLIILPFLISAVFSALAAPPSSYGTGPTQVPKMPGSGLHVSACPSGWTKVGSLASGGFKCQPKKPDPIDCPPGTYYYQKPCEVGCWPEIK